MSAKHAGRPRPGGHPESTKYTEAAMNAQQGRRRERSVGGAHGTAQALGPCCTPIIVATFRNQMLVRLENRHMGRYCVGALDLIDIPTWRAEKGLR